MTEKNNNKNNKPLKFLFVSYWGLCSDLAWTVKKEGNEVRMFINSKPDGNIADGFVDKVEKWEEHVDWADVIIFDDVGFGKTADKLRKEGKNVVSGSEYTDKLENDREFGQEEMKKAGMNILQHWDFTNFDDAIDFLLHNPGRYVLKPSGKAQNEKDLLFIGREEDGKDILQILEHYKKNWAKKIKEFQLQKYVSGVEIAVGAYFNGEDFLLPIHVNFEHKKLFPGEVGPSTGEMGTSGYWSPPNNIFKETLEKMKPALKEADYRGYIDINCIANVRGIYPLEFTSRFGYPTINLQLEGITGSVGEFLHAVATKQPLEIKTKKGFQICVVIAVPPFPFLDPDAFRRYSEDATILFKKPTLDGVHIGEVKISEGEWILAGESGYALIITGSGSTMEEARKQAYLRIKNIMIPNMFYRTDIGLRWYNDSDKLQTWGYLY